MRRRDFIREIIARPFFRVTVALLALLGTASTIREIALPEYAQQKLNLYRVWSLDWPWWLWLLVVLSAGIAVLFEAAFAGILKREGELESLRGKLDETPDVRLEGTFPGFFRASRARTRLRNTHRPDHN